MRFNHTENGEKKRNKEINNKCQDKNQEKQNELKWGGLGRDGVVGGEWKIIKIYIKRFCLCFTVITRDFG